MAGPVEIEWSLDALADLNRFAAFLHERFPDLAARVASELVERAEVLRRHPKLGRAIAGREEYRESVGEKLEGPEKYLGYQAPDPARVKSNIDVIIAELK